MNKSNIYCSIPKNFVCTACQLGKSHRLSFPVSSTVCTKPLQITHANLWSPSPIQSSNGFKYYVSFIDQFSHFTWLYLLKSKTDVIANFKHFKAHVEL